MVDPAGGVEVIGAPGSAQENPRWVIVDYDLLGKHAARLAWRVRPVRGAPPARSTASRERVRRSARPLPHRRQRF